jgi:23S rRNA pseudouridine1911/1915/1917 synthase
MVAAKNDKAHLNLAEQIGMKTAHRSYLAVVHGNIKEEAGIIKGDIGRHPTDRKRMAIVQENGKPAVTHFKVLERFGDYTLVECRLETGRTHQIRVHMSSIGHPLFNDERYGGSEIRNGTIFAKYRQFINNCFQICPRQALHAATLGFIHPHTKKEIRFEAPLPEDMQSLIAKWREYTAAKDTLV